MNLWYKLKNVIHNYLDRIAKETKNPLVTIGWIAVTLTKRKNNTQKRYLP
ncbi:MAG: hypothetical protein K0S47_1112 [Herbinix sp.]|jgi:hypothetical protein|nr:hypothetical protein [Herbinix sp.]